MQMTYDFAIIGAGSGGLSLAVAAAQLGQKVVLFEQAAMGGDCLNHGCVPSKALLAAAKHAHYVKQAAGFGIHCAPPRIDFAAVQQRVQQVIASIAPHDSVARMTSLGIRVVQEAVWFTSPHQLATAHDTYRARFIAIATGSRPRVPDLAGLQDVPYLTNESLFGMSTFPNHLLVLGAGAVGLEMAQAHVRLGARVTVVEQSAPLANSDADLTAIVLQGLQKEGVHILPHTSVHAVQPTREGITLSTSAGPLNGSHLLLAAGRAPNIEALHLEAAGVVAQPKGIVVDRYQRSSQKHIFALGDVAGGSLTSTANFQARLVIEKALFRYGFTAATMPSPQILFTDPELAQVGLSAAQARQKYGDRVCVLQRSFADNDRAQAEGRTDGLTKVVVGPHGHILGAGIVGPHAGELIQPWVLAITQRQKIKQFINQIVAYPTYGDINRRVALDYYAGAAQNRALRFLLKTLRVF